MRSVFILSICLSIADFASADDVNMATPAAGRDSIASEPTLVLQPSIAVSEPGLRESRKVGDYGQPDWSTRRLFSELRTYVIPKGQFEFEYWLFLSLPSRKESHAADQAGVASPKDEVKQVYEAGMGLGHRLQLDLYQIYVKDGFDGNNALDATKLELRYALADWDRIWGNPTLYAEWEQAAAGDDALEFKLLLCGGISGRWRWASNFVWEEKTGGTRDRSLEWNTAFGFAAVDSRLTAGLEANLAEVSFLEDPNGDARHSGFEASAGPSLRLRPIPRAHLILTEFIGLTENASASKSAAIFGWEL